MSLLMHKVALALVCLGCLGYGRRVRSTDDAQALRPFDNVPQAIQPARTRYAIDHLKALAMLLAPASAAAFMPIGTTPLGNPSLMTANRIGGHPYTLMNSVDISLEGTTPSDSTAMVMEAHTVPETAMGTTPSDGTNVVSEKQATPKDTKKKERKTSPVGPFAPAVLAAKRIMGDKELAALRANIIQKHTKVISNFVDTSESKFGQLVLQRMFEAADKDGNGTLDRQEIQEALFALGFTFVKDKDMDQIMRKADVDKNTVIDFEEFVKETPRVLRTNLIKLAKENGHDLGFLA